MAAELLRGLSKGLSMRIANSFFLPETFIAKTEAALFVALSVFFFTPGTLHAADTIQTTSSGLPVLSVEPPSAPASVPVSATGSSSIVLSAEAPKIQKESIDKNLSAMEDEISANAKKVVKRLDVASDTTSLADLNSARQTVTRIEAMIEIEKRLKELEKLRGERGDFHAPPSVSSSLANAIPSSALMPLPSAVSSDYSAPEGRRAKPSSSSSSRPEISHIYGTGGRYTAVLRLSNGDLRSVRVGDKLSGGDTVRAISSSSVDVGGKEKAYTLRVKNIDMVYSSMR